MIIKTIKLHKFYILASILLFIIFLLFFLFFQNNSSIASLYSESEDGNKYIKWVDFNVSYDALIATSKLDISSHNDEQSNIKYNWIELLAYLSCKNGGNLKNFNQKDLSELISKLNSGTNISELTKDMKYYSYYLESYTAILGEFIGEYQIQTMSNDTSINYETKYGIKAFSPIAKNYSFSHYDDFGASRSYGYKRSHLGHDLMGSIGTPIIAIESGIVESLGWNQYGGWRIGIRSFDGKRYYYYAHLRKNYPYAENLYEGKIVTAGDVIGYLGMTGYSATENVNNINVPHLHFGMQLIFDESQKDGTNQIWIDLYSITKFLQQNKSEVFISNKETKDYCRKYDMIDFIF